MNRIIKIDDPKLKTLIVKKEELVEEGRNISKEIDLIKEAKVSVNSKLVEEEGKVDVSDLKSKAATHIDAIKQIAQSVQDIENEILERIKANTPQELRDQYDLLEKQQSDKEQELHKLGHKVQKIKDKIIPLVQKLGKPHLEDEFDDFNTTKLGEDGIPELEIYNSLDEWKARQREIK